MKYASTHFSIKFLKFCFALLATLGSSLSICNAQSYIISTVAGSGTAGYNGDGIAATSAKLNGPSEVEVDDSGNIYIGDSFNQRIRKVNTNGIIHTLAGNGKAGYNGDGIAATSAELDYPYEIMLDTAGNVYITDWSNNRIRLVNTSGIISTITGTGTEGYNGDGINATSAELSLPSGIASDNSGNLYIDDDNNNRIRMVTTDLIISTIAGTGYGAGSGYPGKGGYTGDGGAATAAELHWPSDIKTDAAGNVYTTDQVNHVVRMINSNGIISTIAGDGYGAGTSIGGYTGDGGAATASELNNPTGVALDSHGNIYIADCKNNRIRMVNTNGVISTIAGNGTAGFYGDGGFATAAELNNPTRLTVDPIGNIYVAEAGNNVIRKLTLATSGINPLNSINQSLHVYPTLSRGVFTFQANSQQLMANIQIEVYNILGEQVYSQFSAFFNSQHSINLSGQPNGVYLYRVINADVTILGQGKMIIQK